MQHQMAQPRTTKFTKFGRNKMIFKYDRDGWRARAQRKTLNQLKKNVFRAPKEASDQDPDAGPYVTTDNTNENDLSSREVKSKRNAELF